MDKYTFNFNMCPHYRITKNGDIRDATIYTSIGGRQIRVCELCKKEVKTMPYTAEQINEAIRNVHTLCQQAKFIASVIGTDKVTDIISTNIINKKGKNYMRKVLKTPTDYSNLYDKIYGRFAVQKKYSVTTEYKATLMDNIFSTLPVDEITAVRVLTKGYGSYDHAAKIAKMDKKVLLKSYELGMKHLMSPNNIAIAVNGYYDISGTKTPLTKYDFGEKQYIVSGLAKAGIVYREQLYRHVDNGWYFLWTIPRCGDTARQLILKAFDKWGYKHNIEEILTRSANG